MVICQKLRGAEVNERKCWEEQGGPECAGCTAASRWCLACRAEGIADGERGFCAKCASLVPPIVMINCSMVGEMISDRLCAAEQGALGCIGCLAPTRRCLACSEPGVVDGSRGLCAKCVALRTSLASNQPQPSLNRMVAVVDSIAAKAFLSLGDGVQVGQWRRRKAKKPPLEPSKAKIVDADVVFAVLSQHLVRRPDGTRVVMKPLTILLLRLHLGDEQVRPFLDALCSRNLIAGAVPWDSLKIIPDVAPAYEKDTDREESDDVEAEDGVSEPFGDSNPPLGVVIPVFARRKRTLGENKDVERERKFHHRRSRKKCEADISEGSSGTEGSATLVASGESPIVEPLPSPEPIETSNGESESPVQIAENSADATNHETASGRDDAPVIVMAAEEPALPTTDSALQADWEAEAREMQSSIMNAVATLKLAITTAKHRRK